MRAVLESWIGSRGLSAQISPSQRLQLAAYLTLLRTWNRQLNLTGSSFDADPERSLDRLVLEPLQLTAVLAESVKAVVDVGSGSGSPAIPLLIFRPDIRLTMVESRTRKGVFLREALRVVSLQGAVETTTIEEMASRSNHPVFDAATVRAVRLDERVLTAVARLLAPHGALYYFSTDTATPASNRVTPSRTIRFTEPAGFRLEVFERLAECFT